MLSFGLLNAHWHVTAISTPSNYQIFHNSICIPYPLIRKRHCGVFHTHYSQFLLPTSHVITHMSLIRLLSRGMDLSYICLCRKLFTSWLLFLKLSANRRSVFESCTYIAFMYLPSHVFLGFVVQFKNYEAISKIQLARQRDFKE
jgi:membrane-associated HD superfamily phosphohydrolase